MNTRYKTRNHPLKKILPSLTHLPINSLTQSLPFSRSSMMERNLINTVAKEYIQYANVITIIEVRMLDSIERNEDV